MIRGSTQSARGRAVAALLAAAALGASVLGAQPALGQSGAAPPQYRYDPTWPKLPLPNGWTFEGITGMFVDADDVVWVLQRPRDFDRDPSENYAALDPPTARCCVKPPAVMAFDADGNLLHAWGDPDAVPGWPRSEHTILVDRDGFVWIGGATPGDTLMKFTKDGEPVGELGMRGPVVDAAGQRQDNQQTDVLMRGVAAAEIDEDAREIYIADGYLNRRVLVYDVDSGEFKRGWGAYGKPLAEISNDPPPPYDPEAPPHDDFQGSVHAVRLSADGLVYVSDRQGNRIQVFDRQGEFVDEFFVAPWTLDRGAAGSITFSTPPEQTWLFVTDIMNNVVWILDRRSGETVGEIGFMGHSGGGFHWVHVAASDSQGNLYTGEVDSGKRIQRFVPVDVAQVVASSPQSAPFVPDDSPVVARMTAAARALLQSVRGEPEFSERLRDYSMEDRLLLEFDDEERLDWTYWPTERAGLSIDLMHAKHRALAHELLWTLASEKGYHKLLNIMQLENVLAATSGTGFPRGIEDYTLALFGEPGADAPWAWRFEGHHVSLSVTVVPGQGVTVTPTFLGADPADVRFGPLAGVRVLRVEEDLGRELVTSLSAQQRAVAIVAGDSEYNAQAGYTYAYDAPWDLYASNILKAPDEWDDWKTTLEPDGIRFADLDGAQQATLLALLDEVFTTYRPDVADRYRQSLDLDRLSFAWIGGLERNEPHYYRIQAGDFLFEYDNVQGDGNHVHEVWRSRAGDFGEDLLRRHRSEFH